MRCQLQQPLSASTPCLHRIACEQPHEIKFHCRGDLCLRVFSQFVILLTITLLQACAHQGCCFCKAQPPNASPDLSFFSFWVNREKNKGFKLVWVDGGVERRRKTGCTGDVQLKIKKFTPVTACTTCSDVGEFICSFLFHSSRGARE